MVTRLRGAGCVYAEEEAALLTGATGSPAELASLVEQRVGGRPLEHLLGWADFGRVRVAVDPGVFVPRRRSLLLVDETLQRCPHPGVVVDLCCGSGAIGVALHAARPDLRLYAADLDPVAVTCARRNLDPKRVFEGDLYDALPDVLRGAVDVLVVNAPYVPADELALMPREARDHEPRTALDGGSDGLDVHRQVAASAYDWLAPGGHLVLETSRRQAATTQALVAAAGLETDVVTDDDLDATAVVGRRPSGG